MGCYEPPHGKQTSSARANWWLSASLKRMISCCAAITRRNSAPPGRLTSQKFEIARWPFNIGSVHAPHHESFFLPFYISLSLSSISSYFFYISPGPQLGARRCECSSDSLPRREAGISSRCHGAMLPWLRANALRASGGAATTNSPVGARRRRGARRGYSEGPRRGASARRDRGDDARPCSVWRGPAV